MSDRDHVDTLNLDFLSKWEILISGVDMHEVPVEMLDKIIINTKSGNKVDIDIQALLNQGTDPKDLEEAIQEKLGELEDLIEGLDYHVNVKAVATSASEATDQILKDL
jgi:hypothetical protein